MKIERYLLSKGMRPNLKGFDYWVRAITLCKGDKTYLRGLTKRLYPQLGDENGESMTKVERSLRHCLSDLAEDMCIGEFLARALIDLGEEETRR